MTFENQSLGARLAAILVVLLTIAVVVFGIINFQQRLSFDVPDDGISWVDSAEGVQAVSVAPASAG